MNSTLKAIAERFSCRDFTDEIPNDKDLSAIAHAAIQAPSGMNRQVWQFIVVKNKKLIGDMEAEGLNVLSAMEDKSMYDRIMARGGKLFYNAPCMIYIAVKNDVNPRGAALIDCGIAAQNIAIAASSLGIASLHCGLASLAFAANKADEFKSRLKFQEGYECGMAILLGYAKTPGTPHTPDPEKITVIG